MERLMSQDWEHGPSAERVKLPVPLGSPTEHPLSVCLPHHQLRDTWTWRGLAALHTH